MWPGLIPRLGIVCGLSLSFVRDLPLRGFSLVLQFSSLFKNQHFQIPIQSELLSSTVSCAPHISQSTGLAWSLRSSLITISFVKFYCVHMRWWDSLVTKILVFGSLILALNWAGNLSHMNTPAWLLGQLKNGLKSSVLPFFQHGR